MVDRMVVDFGFSRENTQSCCVDTTHQEIGAGRMSCPECGGDGDWTKFYPEPDKLTEPLQCVDCKGTGIVWVGL